MRYYSREVTSQECFAVHCLYKDFRDPIGVAFRNLTCNKVLVDATGRGGRHGLTPQEHIWFHENVAKPARPSVAAMIAAIAVHRQALESGVRCPNCLTIEEFREKYLVTSPMTPLGVFMREIGITDKVKAGEILYDLGVSVGDAADFIKALPPDLRARLLLAPLMNRQRNGERDTPQQLSG